MNPIFIEYYSHEHCDYYKIKVPWARDAEEKVILCRVEYGYEYAKLIAIGVIVEHLRSVTQERPK